MKRYLLFAGSHYHPSGGIEDFIGSFDTVTEAKVDGEKWGWAQVVEIQDDGFRVVVQIVARRDGGRVWSEWSDAPGVHL